MDDLPELPFELMLSYLSLEDRLKARAVSRRWYHKINCFRVKTLCYSDRPSDFIWGKRRLAGGASFAQNFISSTQFASFFNTFRQTILSNLKHLRLCDLNLDEENRAALAGALNSFGQLEELDIIRLGVGCMILGSLSRIEIELNLPMLRSIHLEKVRGIERMVLNAPRLKRVKLWGCWEPRLHLVHAESVERVLVDSLKDKPMNLKNLQCLHTQEFCEINSTFLSSLEQLKEIHLQSERIAEKLFVQKQRYGRTELKVYLWGVLLNGPDDLARLSSGSHLDKKVLRRMAENQSRLADDIPFHHSFYYEEIEPFAPSSEMTILKPFTDLRKIYVGIPVLDIERFLNILSNFGNIVELWFWRDQPQDLFDRLPEHCTVQWLSIDVVPSDFRFLFRLKHLLELRLTFSTDDQTVRKVLEKLPFLLRFYTFTNQKWVTVEIDHLRRFKVSACGRSLNCTDVNTVMQFIAGD